MKIPKIKICGLTRACDIDYINEALPDYIGFVFAKSKRQIQEEEAAKLKRRVNKGITTVGVFVNAPKEQIQRLVRNAVIDVIQLHGDETPADIKEIRRETTCPIIKAVRIGGKEYSEMIFNEYEKAGIDYFLFDSGYRGTGNPYGGTGTPFDWNGIPKTNLPYFLAGGLQADNIREAIARTRPYAVDISSGVETNGVKDRDKIVNLIRSIRDENGQ